MRFEELTAKIPVHPQMAGIEDLQPRLTHLLGYMLVQKLTETYGTELSTAPSNFADYFTKGFNDVKLKMEVPILTADEIAALRKDPELIERAIDEGEVVIP